MSYYEYYEFLAIDRPFSDEARKEFAKLSRRANVTGRSASYVYNYGNFRGQPDDLVQRHCDFFFYMANWGIRLLMKMPEGAVDLDTLATYEGDDGGIRGRRAGPGFLVSFATGEERYLDGWLEGEGLIEEKTGSAYDEAMGVLADRYRKRPALVRRLKEGGFLAEGWKPSPVPLGGSGLFGDKR